MNNCNCDVDIEELQNEQQLDEIILKDYIVHDGKIDGIKVNGILQTIVNKIVDIFVPTKTSEITNDSNFQNATQVNAKVQEAKDLANTKVSQSSYDEKMLEVDTELQSLDTNKVDKEVGKGLSTNDFTNTLKIKLDGLENYDDTEIKQDIQELETNKANASDVYNKTQTYNKTEIDSKDSATLQSAKDYADTKDSATLQSAKDYTDNEVGAEATLRQAKDTELEGYIDDIEELIPNQATQTNQLADKEFVNSSITTNTAFFRGTYNLVDDLGLTSEATHEQVAVALKSVILEVTNNDYSFVFYVNETTSLTEYYYRYKYSSDIEEWAFEYRLNNSSFTAQQWASINSGITALLVAQITTNQSAITTINESLTALGLRVGTNETNISNLQSAVSTLQSDLSALASRVGTAETNITNLGTNKEDVSNKVDTITNDSTKYTSAKAIYQYFASGNGGGTRQIGNPNWNNVIDTGVYYSTGSGATNYPTGESPNAYVIVLRHSSNVNYALQIYVANNTDNYYFRRLQNGTWNDWKKLSNDNEVVKVVSQSLTDSEKTIARNNINALGTTDGTPSNPLPTLDMDLLWENPNPSDTFGTQTISIPNLSNYSLILIKTRVLASNSVNYCDDISKYEDGSSLMLKGSFYGAKILHYFRHGDYVGNSISFRNCYVCNDSFAVQNDRLIPYQIYGIRANITDRR